jgi:hypothetical protein
VKERFFVPAYPAIADRYVILICGDVLEFDQRAGLSSWFESLSSQTWFSQQTGLDFRRFYPR